MRNFSKQTLAFSVAFALIAQPAFGYTELQGMETDAGLSVLQTLCIFVGGPVGIFALVWFLWSIPAWRRANKPKSGSEWNPTGQ